MHAITVEPGRPGSVRLDTVAEPEPSDGAILLETIGVGICGTDREIIKGAYGVAPAGRDRLVLGHESLCRVIAAPDDSGLSSGDHAVAIVRRPDPVPCAACAIGEWDMCLNGRYLEHGIKGLDGFCRERFRADAPFVVPVSRDLGLTGVLLEPASVVAKAWDHIDRIGGRSRWTPHRVLVLGAGPIGLLAALLAALRGLEVHVLDRVTTGPKPDLVRALGATYHTGSVEHACEGADIVLECTGVPKLVIDAMRCVSPTGIVCLAGVSSGHRVIPVDAGALNNDLVLENNVVFGTVNANRLHYDRAAEALTKADRSWLEALLTRRVPLDQWRAAYEPADGDVKTVLQFGTL